MLNMSNDPIQRMPLLSRMFCTLHPIPCHAGDFIYEMKMKLLFVCVSDEALHKIMDINKVFPKPREVEEELRKKREEDEVKAEKEELQRIKSLAPPVQPPKMCQLIEEGIVSISCQ